MIHRVKGTIQVECDDCGDVLDTDTNDFQEAQAHMRTESWKACKVGDVWTHSCLACLKKGRPK